MISITEPEAWPRTQLSWEWFPGLARPQPGTVSEPLPRLSRMAAISQPGLSGPDAATVARNWISANKALSDSRRPWLKVINDARLAQSDGYVVNFRQQFGSLLAAEDGLLTVGLVGSAASDWKIAYVSSSVTGDETVTGVKQLSAQDAWLKAAANVGRSGVINNTKADREWTLLGIPGFANVQRVRLLALPTPNNGVRPVYETLILDNRAGHMTAYTHYVDAANGTIWLRKDLVEQSHPTAEAFSGTVPLVDGACAPDNGPWVVTASESIGSVAVTVAATLPANDVVIHLLRDGNIVASQDTATSPEALLYDPVDNGVGSYTVRVCDFGDGRLVATKHLQRADRVQSRRCAGGPPVSAKVESLPGQSTNREPGFPVELPKHRHPPGLVLGVDDGLPAGSDPGMRDAGSESCLSSAVGLQRAHEHADFHNLR